MVGYLAELVDVLIIVPNGLNKLLVVYILSNTDGTELSNQVEIVKE